MPDDRADEVEQKEEDEGDEIPDRNEYRYDGADDALGNGRLRDGRTARAGAAPFAFARRCRRRAACATSRITRRIAPSAITTAIALPMPDITL